MTNYFVAPTGSDSASGLSGSPVRTIARALAIAAPADDIEVATGTYAPFSWTSKNGINLHAAAGATVIVEAATAYTPAYGTGSIENVARVAGLTAFTIAGIRFRNARNQWGNGLLIENCAGSGVEGSRSIQIIDCEFDHNHSFGWQIKNSHGIDVIRPLEYKNDTGHQLSGSYDVWIDSPTSHDNDQMVVQSAFTTKAGGASGTIAASIAVNQIAGIKLSTVSGVSVNDYLKVGSEIRRITRVGTAGSGGTGVDVAYQFLEAHASGTAFVEVETGGGDRGGNAGVFYYSHDIRESGGTYYNNRARSDQYGADGGAFETFGAWNITLEDWIEWDNENTIETGQASSADRSDGSIIRNGVAFDFDPSFPAPLVAASLVRKPFGMILRAFEGGLVEHITMYGKSNGFDVEWDTDFGGSIDGLTIRDSIVFGGGAGTRCLWVQPGTPGSVTIDYLDLYNPGGSLGHRVGTDNLNGITTDPVFTDRAALDFRLASTSPAIAAGHDGSDMGNLFAGTPPAPPPDPGDPPPDPGDPPDIPPGGGEQTPTPPPDPVIVPPPPPPVRIRQTVSARFAEVVRQAHTRVARITLLDANLAVVAELDGTGGVAINGSVAIDNDRRRSCSLRIANPGGAWTPSGPADPLFVNRLIRIERGIMVDGNPELVPLGLFLIDRPTISVTQAGSTISISGQDRVKLAAKSRFTTPETYPAGMALSEVVRAIATAAGMGGSLFDLDDAGKVLAYDRTFESDSDRWPAIGQLATDYALTVYVDADGYLVLEPSITPDTLPEPSWTFERGAEAVMLGLTKEWSDDQLYNHVRVSGESANLAPVAAEARDLNPASPAYNPTDGTGPIGDRLWTYTSAMIRSIEQAAEVAAAKLLEVALVQEAITVPSVVIPSLQVGDAVDIIEPLSATADRYLLDTVVIPLGPGEMTVTARKLRDLRAL